MDFSRSRESLIYEKSTTNCLSVGAIYIGGLVCKMSTENLKLMACVKFAYNFTSVCMHETHNPNQSYSSPSNCISPLEMKCFITPKNCNSMFFCSKSRACLSWESDPITPDFRVNHRTTASIKLQSLIRLET